MERKDQVWASNNFGLGWSEQSKDNQRIAQWVDTIKEKIFYRICDGAGAGADPEDTEEVEEEIMWEGR